MISAHAGCAMKYNNLLTPLVLMTTMSAAPAFAESGIASRYSDLSETASGKSYKSHELVAAHRTLPFGTKVRVYNRSNGSSVVVTIVDRGPFIKRRIIDLSSGAAEQLGFVGLEQVHLSIVP